MVALSWCHVTLSTNRPDNRVRPALLHSFADHIRERRLDLDLQKKQLARQLCVDETTIHNWEDKGVAPALRLIPRIIEFLGYLPFDKPETLSERLVQRRKLLGLSRKQTAKLLGIDPSNLAGWETGNIGQPKRRKL